MLSKMRMVAIAAVLALGALRAWGAAGYVYALSDISAGNQIFGFAVDEAGGNTPLAGFPVTSGGLGTGGQQSQRMVLDAANKRLFVINQGSLNVTGFSIDQITGKLTALPFGALSLGAGVWTTVVVHPSGSPLVVGDVNGLVQSFQITATTATLAAGSPYNVAPASPFSSAFSLDGNFVYTGGSNGTKFAGFSVNASTGVLTPLAGSPFDSGDGLPLSYATDSSGRLYLANYNLNAVRVFTTAAGIPTAAAGNPFVSGLTETIHGVFHPSGFYMVTDRNQNKVGVFKVNGTGGATTLTAVAGSPFATNGILASVLALNSTGSLLFAVHGTSRNITTFTVNAGTGALAVVGTQAADTIGTGGRVTGLAYIDAIPSADLVVSVDAPAAVVGGTKINYTLKVSNKGPSTQTAIKVSYGLTGGASSGLVDSSGASAPGVFNIATLDAGKDATLALSTTIPTNTAPGTVYTFSAKVDSAKEILVSTGDDSVSVNTTVTEPFVSPASASPASAGVGQLITFSAAAANNSDLVWDFGDGSSAPGQTVKHAYQSAGTYTATVSYADKSISSSVQVMVLAPIVGTGSDHDGDRYSDTVEYAAGSDVLDPNSTPGGVAASQLTLGTLQVSKIAIKMNFVKANIDSIQLAGTVDLPAGFVPATTVIVDIGGIAKQFALDAKGNSPKGDNTFKLGVKSKKGVVAAQTAKYTVSYKKGAFAGPLLDEGLTSTAPVKNAKATVALSMLIGGKVLSVNREVTFSVSKGKTLTAK